MVVFNHPFSASVIVFRGVLFLHQKSTDVVFWDNFAKEPIDDFNVICRFLVEAGACVADPLPGLNMLRYF